MGKNLTGLATEWDIAEKKRVENVSLDSLRRLDPSGIRKKLFPRPVERRLQQPHASLYTSDLDTLEYVSTLLLFYDSIILWGCHNCIQPKRLPTISTLVERGLAVPVISGHYDTYQSESLKFLERFQEDHVSAYASSRYMYAALNPVSLSEDPRSRPYCATCLKNGIEDATSQMPNYDLGFRKLANKAAIELTSTASPLMMRQLDTFRQAVKSGNIDEIMKFGFQTHSIAKLEHANAYESVPLLRLDEYEKLQPGASRVFPELRPTLLEMANFCAKGLRVDYTPDMPLDRYLDIIQDYRGTLRNTLPSASNPTATLSSSREVVSQLNEQIREISNSKRYKLGSYAINLARIPAVFMLLVKIATGGDHDIGPALSQVLQSTRKDKTRPPVDTPRLPTKTERFLASYFRKTLLVVQVWNIQRKVSKLHAH